MNTATKPLPDLEALAIRCGARNVREGTDLALAFTAPALRLFAARVRKDKRLRIAAYRAPVERTD